MLTPLTSRAFGRRMAGAGLVRRQARGGGGARSIDAAILALAPYSFVEADYYSVDGVSGNVAAFLDKVPAGTGIKAIDPTHALSQATSALQIALPTADAALRSRLSAVFAGASWYRSTAVKTAWNLLHQGPYTLVYVYTRTGEALYLYSTIDGTTGAYMQQSAGGVVLSTFSAGSFAFNSATATGGVNGKSVYSTYQEGASPEFTVGENGVEVANGPSILAPGGDCEDSLVLGASSFGALPMTENWASLVVFNRVLSAGDLAIVSARNFSKYGVH